MSPPENSRIKKPPDGNKTPSPLLGQAWGGCAPVSVCDDPLLNSLSQSLVFPPAPLPQENSSPGSPSLPAGVRWVLVSAASRVYQGKGPMDGECSLDRAVVLCCVARHNHGAARLTSAAAGTAPSLASSQLWAL